jgi:hypothetical protein
VIKRGSERIRTAVGAFAELSLATRPRNHFNSSYFVSKLSLPSTGGRNYLMLTKLTNNRRYKEKGGQIFSHLPSQIY